MAVTSTILSSRSFIHSSVSDILQLIPCSVLLLPGESHGRRSLVGCSPWGCSEADTTGWLHFHFPLSCPVEGNGNPLQCPCLDIPRDGGARWAAVYGVAQSWTRLKRLSSSSTSVCSLVLLGLLVNISYIFSIFASVLFLRSCIIFTIIILNFFLEGCPSPLYLVVFLGFYLVLSFFFLFFF